MLDETQVDHVEEGVPLAVLRVLVCLLVVLAVVVGVVLVVVVVAAVAALSDKVLLALNASLVEDEVVLVPMVVRLH